MCGIVGLVNLKGESVSLSVLKNMTDSISHRGPDGEGHWIEENVGLGHRRLSIIDLSLSGSQPMTSLCDRYVITYNGEVYNYKQLRRQLESKGFVFKSNTDTEVVLNAFIAWGELSVERFNGMFAFGIWDRLKKTLFLARDRYGIKPLYISRYSGVLSFASEQKALEVVPGFKSEMDKEALLEYFTFQNIFTNKTFQKNIEIFPAGHYATINPDNFKQKIPFRKYWDFEFCQPDKVLSRSEYKEELQYLFSQAVKRQLVSDVEVGAYLSGGMDSGSICAVASQNVSNLKTFTCGFNLEEATGLEIGFDESNQARMMSQFFGTQHYEYVLNPGDMESCLPDLSYHLEEPRVGQSYPNYYASKLASKHVKVVMSGAGGDELFAGYPWRYYRGLNHKTHEDFVNNYYIFWQRLISNKNIKKVFNPIWSDISNINTRDIFDSILGGQRAKTPEEVINQSLTFEAKTFLHGLLVVEDKLSMSHGLETRVPFLDNDLVDFAVGCPVEFKLNNLDNVLNLNENEIGGKKNRYFVKSNDGKQILRDALEDLLPDDVGKATKQGFSAPDASWFRGSSIDYVRKVIMNSNALIYKYLDSREVKLLVEEHLTGKSNRRLLIWSLLNFESILQGKGGVS